MGKISKRLKSAASRVGSLLLLLQKSPLVQWILPEAQLAGRAGLGEITKWTVAAYAGLSAYDGVAGASGVSQILPSPGSTTVNGAVASGLSFIFQVTGTEMAPKSWQITGAIPNGLTFADTIGVDDYTDSISGIPTLSGTYPITITAWELPMFQGNSLSQAFNIVIGTAIITNHPASVAISSGSTTTLSVTGSGSPLTYQWYSGNSPTITTPITNATSSTFTTPALTSEARYWVRVTRSGVIANSNTAVVGIKTVAQPPVINSQPAGVTINAGETAILSVAATGISPTYQWYRGAKGDTSNPVPTGLDSTVTTPVLSETASFWVMVTDGGLSVDSEAAVAAVRTAFETWANSVFTAEQLADPLVSGIGADPDKDGLTNEREHVAGTPPIGGVPGVPLGIARTAGFVELSFVAKAASGAGYFGKTRHYVLEERADLTTGVWTPVTGFEDIPGAGQTVTHTVPSGAARGFYHLKVWLTP